MVTLAGCAGRGVQVQATAGRLGRSWGFRMSKDKARAGLGCGDADWDSVAVLKLSHQGAAPGIATN